MSNYIKPAYHPVEKVVRVAHFLDNHFGHHQYGVQFPGDTHVFKPAETDIPLDVVFVPKPKDG